MTTVSQVIAALANWEKDSAPLIGVFESQELEFKMTAYQLGSDPGRSEFAKDIAGMANASGGLIVLGIETASDPSLGRDKSVAVRPLAPGLVDLSQIENVARTWIYPPQRDLEVIEWPDSTGQLLVSIRVPGMADMGGLAVVLGPGDPPDRRTIGVPIRAASRVDFHTAAEIYDWIRRGRIQAATGTETASIASEEDAAAQLDRVRSDYVEGGPSGEAVFFLQAWPSIATRIEHIHDTDGLRGLFLNPPEQRYAGFGWWGLQPEVDSSGGIRVSRDAISFWVTPSGVATAVVSQGYLTWAMEHYVVKDAQPLVNSIVLGEVTYEFCRAYLAILKWAEPRPPSAFFRVGLFRALEPKPLHLGKGRPEAAFYGYETHTAVHDTLDDIIGPLDVSDVDDRAAELAASILRRFYELFGMGRETIPHLTSNGQRFDPSALRE